MSARPSFSKPASQKIPENSEKKSISDLIAEIKQEEQDVKQQQQNQHQALLLLPWTKENYELKHKAVQAEYQRGHCGFQHWRVESKEEKEVSPWKKCDKCGQGCRKPFPICGKCKTLVKEKTCLFIPNPPPNGC